MSSNAQVIPPTSARDDIDPEFRHLIPAYSYTILSIAAMPE